MGAVVKFLGFNPFPKCDSVAQRLVNHRKALGMTQKAFAGQLGIDPSTLARWERGERKPKGQVQLPNIQQVLCCHYAGKSIA